MVIQEFMNGRTVEKSVREINSILDIMLELEKNRVIYYSDLLYNLGIMTNPDDFLWIVHMNNIVLKYDSSNEIIIGFKEAKYKSS